MPKIKVLFLYSEVMSYTVAALEALVKNHDVEAHVIRWDKKRLTPFNPPVTTNIIYYLRSEYNDKQLLVLIKSIEPKLCYISGWMDKGYLQCGLFLKKK